LAGVLTVAFFQTNPCDHCLVVVADDGKVKTFCIYAAPDEDTVLAHSAALGQHTIDLLHEIAGDVTPADFPPV
jgi:hypothetical protein